MMRAMVSDGTGPRTLDPTPKRLRTALARDNWTLWLDIEGVAAEETDLYGYYGLLAAMAAVAVAMAVWVRRRGWM